MRSNIVIIVCIVGLAATSGLALYYRNQAISFEQQWQAATALSPAAQPTDGDRANLKERSHEARAIRPESSTLSPSRTESQGRVKDSPPTVTAPGAALPDPGNQAGPRRRGEDWMAAFQTNDPVRYEAFQKRRQEAKERAETAYAQATNYFMFRDTQNMTDADMEEYTRMLTLLEQTRAMTQHMQSGLPPEERRPTMSAIRSNLVALTPLLNNERDQEIFDLAVTMGHTSADAESIVTYVNQISSNTSLRVIFPDLPRRGPPDGFPGPRP